MLDRRFILENVDLVKQNCTHRGVRVDVDQFVALEQQRKALQVQVEELNRKANEVSKSIGKAKDPAEREARKEEGRQLREKAQGCQTDLDRLAAELDAIHRQIPNLSHPDAPVGVDDKSNLELARGQTPLPKFDFTPLDHVELAEKLDLVDFEAGARVAGHGFYFLKNEAVLLELALQRYAVEVLDGRGLYADHHARPCPQRRALRHRLHSPRAGDANLQHRELRPEPGGHGRDHPGRHAGRRDAGGRTAAEKFCGISHCFRTEAGAHGKATRGLFRVHQFTKIEMFAFTLPEQSDAMLEELRAWNAGCSTDWACPIAWSTRPPATWAVRPIASTTWRPGCPAAASSAK